MQDIGKMLSGRDGEKLRALADTPEAQALGRLIDPAEAEKAAKTGDTEALREMLRRILSTDEGKKLAGDISGALGK